MVASPSAFASTVIANSDERKSLDAVPLHSFTFATASSVLSHVILPISSVKSASDAWAYLDNVKVPETSTVSPALPTAVWSSSNPLTVGRFELSTMAIQLT